jgi:uncharacterized protein (DUF2141 family)
MPLISVVPPAAIVVVVENVRNARGKIHVDICDETQFLKKCPLSGEAPAQVGAVSVLIEGVMPGDYAAQAFHDENENGKVDRELGIPSEGVGFSNNVKVRMHPPRFIEAAFHHGPEPQEIHFRLRYYMGDCPQENGGAASPPDAAHNEC